MHITFYFSILDVYEEELFQLYLISINYEV